jgi:hypothetical protein
MRTLFQELKSWERVLLFSSLILFCLLSLSDAALLHPGLCEIDETLTLRDAWDLLQGGRLWPSLFSGTWQHLLASLFLLLLPGKLWALALSSLLAFLLETFLLMLLAQRLWSARAAWGAALFNLLSAFSLARSRALLSYSLLPCEMLLLLQLALVQPRYWKAWLAGLGAALCMLDYEAWPLGLACMALFFFFELTDAFPAFLTGALLGSGLSLWLSKDSLSSYWALRSAFTLGQHPAGDLGWGSNLLKFFTGGHVLPSMGVEGHPALAPWALPLLVLGAIACLRQRPWILAWAALGLLPLLLPTAGLTEANRGIAAWPALALLAGLGISQVPRQGTWPWALGLWMIFGAGLEADAFLRSQEILGPSNYAQTQAQLKAGAWLKAEASKTPVHFLSGLGSPRGEELEWASGLPEKPSLQSGQRVLAWIPWEAVPALGKNAGLWHEFGDPREARHILILEPNASWGPKLEAFDSQLGPLLSSLNPYDRLGNLAKIQAWLASPEIRDPWVRTVLWQRLATDLSLLGKLDQNELDALLKEPLVHAGPLNYPSYYVARYNPALALKMREKALQIDARLRPKAP